MKSGTKTGIQLRRSKCCEQTTRNKDIDEVEKELDIQFPKGDKAIKAKAKKIFKEIKDDLKDTCLKIVFQKRLQRIEKKHTREK